MTTEAQNGRPQTFGEKAVGLSFNPSNDDLVTQIKKRFADDIDEMNSLRLRTKFGFDGALRHIKEGRCVARRGWNGRGIFVFLNRGAAHFSDTDTIPPLIDGIKRGLFEQWAGGVATRTPNISIQSASGSTTHGWAPSQTDLLAEDWYIA